MLGIDPWNYTDSEIKVDDEVSLRLKDHNEFGMGSPLLGGLELVDKPKRFQLSFEKRYFGGPPYWSEGKKLFLIPEWKTASLNKIFGGVPRDWQEVLAIDFAKTRIGAFKKKFVFAHILGISDDTVQVKDTNEGKVYGLPLSEFEWKPF